MGVGASLYMYDVVVKKVQVRYLIPDEFLSCMTASNLTKITERPQRHRMSLSLPELTRFQFV